MPFNESFHVHSFCESPGGNYKVKLQLLFWRCNIVYMFNSLIRLKLITKYSFSIISKKSAFILLYCTQYWTGLTFLCQLDCTLWLFRKVIDTRIRKFWMSMSSVGLWYKRAMQLLRATTARGGHTLTWIYFASSSLCTVKLCDLLRGCQHNPLTLFICSHTTLPLTYRFIFVL